MARAAGTDARDLRASQKPLRRRGLRARCRGLQPAGPDELPLRISTRPGNGPQDWLDAELGRKLVGVFRPTNVGRLARRVQGQTRAEVSLSFTDPDDVLRFHFAEGLRKLATVAWLVANDRLQRRGSLFWDEPEANLNPRLIRALAPVVVGLAKRGVQVFVATHSLFLIRELVVARQQVAPDLDVRFIGLHPGDDGVEVHEGPEITDSMPIAALDESSQQTGRYLAAVREGA